jgi:hypothetical protein
VEAVSGSDTTAASTVIFWKTSNCVSKVLILWWSRGLRSRSRIPGEPERTTTGDFSAYAPAIELAQLRPPTH